jgi:hypothetical protein
VSNIVYLDFGKSKRGQQGQGFSVDIYCGNLKRYQIDISASCIEEAFNKIIQEVAYFKLRLIKCFVLFDGYISQRKKVQPALKIWENTEIRKSLA